MNVYAHKAVGVVQLESDPSLVHGNVYISKVNKQLHAEVTLAHIGTRKKAQTMPSSVGDAMVTQVLSQGGSSKRIGPVIVKFEHCGRVKDGDFCTGFKADLSARFRSNVGNPDLKLELEASNGLVYSNLASSVPKNDDGKSCLKTYVAYRDKESNTLRIEEANVVTVGAVVQAPKTANLLLTSVVAEDLKTRRSASKKHLVRQFGQAKGQRIYEQIERLQVDSEQIDNKMKFAAETVSEESMQMPLQARTETLTPPVNKDADNVYDVYRKEDLLHPGELEELTSCAEEFLEGFPGREDIRKAVEEKSISPILGSIMEDLWPRGSSAAPSLGLALYMDCIVTLLGSRVSALDKGGAKILSYVVSSALKTKVFDMFTEGSNHRLTPVSRDRAICHVLVLGLLANNFSLDFHKVSSTLRKKPDMLSRLCYLVGAKVESDLLSGKKMIVLKLPLANFDPDKVMRGRKRKAR